MELELKTDINDYNLVGGDATETVELTKPRKKKVYTAPKTEKQLANFDKAREIRLEKIRLKKLEDQEKIIKQILDNEKKIKKSPAPVATLPSTIETSSLSVASPLTRMQSVDSNSDSDSDSDEEIIIKSKPKSKPKVKKPKKKTVVYLSDSDSDDDEEDEIPVPVQKSRVQRKVSNIVKQHPGMQPTEFKNYFI